MPVYLVHGFRWPREGFTGIRVHAVVHNLDDCSVEYIQNENSRAEILASFRRAWPDIMSELDGPAGGTRSSSSNSNSNSISISNSKLEFIEQYDPDDLEGPTAVSQPYAYVADKVVMIAAKSATSTASTTSTSMLRGGPGAASTTATTTTAPQPASGEGHSTPSRVPSKKPILSPRAPALSTPAPLAGAASTAKLAPVSYTSPAAPDITALSLNVDQVIAEGPGTSAKAWEAFADLRDKIAEGENIGWWVVYNGDPERSFADDNLDMDEDDEEEEYEEDTEVEHDKMDDTEDDQRAQQRAQQRRRQQQQQPVARPRTAPSDNATAHTRQPVPGPTMPHISTQQQQTLTALPIRPGLSETAASATRTHKGKQNQSIPEPAGLKETARSQGLRKKFFGKRL